jgi:hypothetical protein
MSLVYLPVEARDGLTSKQRADKLDAEFWRLQRPLSVQSSGDTKHMYARVVHPTTGQVAILADTSDVLSVHQDTDLTDLLAILTEVPQSEKDALSSYINANLGGTVLFSNLIPSTATQLTEAEASTGGWIPSGDTP